MKDMRDGMRLRGRVDWWVQAKPGGPIIRRGSTHNLITDLGAEMYLERALGIASPPAAPVGMKLGTGSTAPAVTGAGSALQTYLTGSNLVFDGGFPTSSLVLGARRGQFKCTWGAGVAVTATPITEVVLFNDANANATSTAANTLARALITGGAKDSNAVLTVIWNHDLTPA